MSRRSRSRLKMDAIQMTATWPIFNSIRFFDILHAMYDFDDVARRELRRETFQGQI